MLVSTKSLTWASLFIALGILFPILFHILGIGSLLLPMFWPVAASAFFLSWPYALAVGVLTPILSTILTGLPPLSPPIVYIMIFELGFLAGVTSICYQKTNLGLFWPLFVGLLISRVVLFITVIPLANIFGLPPTLASVVTVVKGMPGVLAMLIGIPLFVNRINHEVIFAKRNTNPNTDYGTSINNR